MVGMRPYACRSPRTASPLVAGISSGCGDRFLPSDLCCNNPHTDVVVLGGSFATGCFIGLIWKCARGALTVVRVRGIAAAGGSSAGGSSAAGEAAVATAIVAAAAPAVDVAAAAAARAAAAAAAGVTAAAATVATAAGAAATTAATTSVSSIRVGLSELVGRYLCANADHIVWGLRGRAVPARSKAGVVIADLVLATSFLFWDQSRTTFNATAPQGEGVPIRHPGLAEGYRR